MQTSPSAPTSLTRFAWLSIAAAIITIVLKVTAYLLTGSVGLLSDALESSVNLAAAIVALIALRMLIRPADDEFTFGYAKVEYFSSGFEGGMILLAAAGIIYSALPRLFNPQPLEQLGLGLAISVFASLINLVVAQLLLRAGKTNNSLTLEADGHHLMTDVWTTVGVLAGIALVMITKLLWLDPIIAILVALNILFTGYRLLKRSWHGLMDVALPPEDLAAVKAIIERHAADGVQYHALRTRQAASRSFLTVHPLVPGDWSVSRGHLMAHQIEGEIRAILPGANIATHIEPANDPLSLKDAGIDPAPAG